MKIPMKKTFLPVVAGLMVLGGSLLVASPTLAATPVDSGPCTLPINPVRGTDGFFLVCNGQFWQSCGFSPAPAACRILGGGSGSPGTGVGTPSPIEGTAKYLTTNLWSGDYNPTDQVRLLQTFLNTEVSAGLPVTGLFGALTVAAVKKFQEAGTNPSATYLKAGYTSSTGFVGQYTRDLINAKLGASLSGG
jgi:hypothetical protein